MFYDTHDPSNPVYVDTFRVTWESANDGLGQVALKQQQSCLHKKHITSGNAESTCQWVTTLQAKSNLPAWNRS
eukprot:3195155-Amphidinium_carterae.1